MRYLIGTDEAGYGPNLGPLVISATVWEVPDEVGVDDLYRRLGEVVALKAAAGSPSSAGNTTGRASRATQPARVVMADSKAIYSNGKGLRQLETGLLAALGFWAIGRERGATCGKRSRPRRWTTCRPSLGTPSSTGRCPATARRMRSSD